MSALRRAPPLGPFALRLSLLSQPCFLGSLRFSCLMSFPFPGWLGLPVHSFDLNPTLVSPAKNYNTPYVDLMHILLVPWYCFFFSLVVYATMSMDPPFEESIFFSLFGRYPLFRILLNTTSQFLFGPFPFFPEMAGLPRDPFFRCSTCDLF